MSLPPQFTRVARKCCRSWRLDQPLQRGSKFNNDTNELMYSSQRKITNIHIKTDGLGIRTSLCTHQTLWRPHRGEKPTWWHASSRSNGECPKNMRNNAGRFPSAETFANRENCWQSWWPNKRTPKRQSTTTIPHTSNHVLTRTEIHKHTKHKFQSCIKCSQPSAVATTS